MKYDKKFLIFVLFLGDPFDFLSNVPKFLTFLPSCSMFRQLYRSNVLKRVFTKIGASNVLLFYNFLPEKRSPVLRPNDNMRNCSCFRFVSMHKYFDQLLNILVSAWMLWEKRLLLRLRR